MNFCKWGRDVTCNRHYCSNPKTNKSMCFYTVNQLQYDSLSKKIYTKNFIDGICQEFQFSQDILSSLGKKGLAELIEKLQEKEIAKLKEI